MTDAFSTLVGIDLVNLQPEKDRVVRALRLAHITIDALVGNDQSHVANYPSLRMTCPIDPARGMR
jgi:hypothetical protein